jgi:hypothetical protein
MLFLYSTLWMLQIVACLAYCLYTKRYLPSKIYESHLLLKQINLYLIGVIVFYMGESACSQIIFKCFEKFLHHFFAMFLFAFAIYEPNLICLNWMLPTFVHASYWTLVKFLSFSFTYPILMVYNLLLFISTINFLRFSHWNVKIISNRATWCAANLFFSNMLGHFYGYNINFYNLDTQKFLRSLLISTALTSPLYLYLFYSSFKWRLILNKILKLKKTLNLNKVQRNFCFRKFEINLK